MAARLRPRKWVLLDSCTAKCGSNAAHIGDANALILHGWYEQGLNDTEIARNCFQAGFPIGQGSIGRHRANHMEPLAEQRESRSTTRRSDLEIIESMIQAGGDRAGQFKMTPSETMKAMELKYKLTQGSAFEGMLDALNRAAMEEDDIVPAVGDPSVGDFALGDDDS